MSTEFDAFTGGVELGGLRKKNDIKVTLCYVLSSIDSAISKTALNNALLSIQIVNFFEFNEALSVLVENGLVNEDKREDDSYYSLSPEGASVAEKLETEIPIYIRDRAVVATIAAAARERRNSYAHANAEKLDKGYQAVLSLTDGDTLMMKTVIYTADSLQAAAVCNSFMDNPQKLYAAIIDAVTR